MTKEKNNNINFIFGMLNKKTVITCLLIEAFDDFIYYVVPFTFTFLLTLPFTLKKAILVASIFILSKVIKCITNYILRKIADNYLYKYSNIEYLEYYKKVTQVPVETLSKYQTGYLENMIEKTSSLVEKILQAEYVSIFLSLFFFFYTVYKQSIILFFISLILSVLCIYVSVRILKKANKQVEKLYDQEYIYSSIYQDYISNIKTVKALNDSKYFEKNIIREGKKCYNENKKYIKYYSMEELIRNTLIVIPFILAILKAVVDLSNGIDTVGIIAFYISLQVEMGFIFDELSGNIINWFELKAIKNKLKILFKKIDNRVVLQNFNKIKLNHVIIKYKESKFDIIINNLEINKNDKILITGKSGQGKTTLINVILGNISSYEGDITIDEHNLKNVRLDIGIVSQEIELFNMSIKDNLCLDKKIPDEHLINYLKELELDEIIMFDKGIHTIVGEKGLKLSTGQKRRINLLRSYLMEKDIYILDEPTSNLDKHTEEVVVNFILKYFQNKTLIITTHNDKINKICNKFYHFENHELNKIEDNKKTLS